ncbi:hypothetical protein VPHK367G1_0065 [Vibrio phage K367 g1]
MAIRKDVEYPGRWLAATTDYPMGEPKNRTTSTSKDGSYLEKKWIQDYEAFLGAALGEAGETPNGVQDTALDSQIYKAMQKGRQVLPFNSDWNGFMEPSHQYRLPSASGYPGNSSGGEVVYSSGDEITMGIFSGSNLNSVSSDDDGWIFSGSIYKEYAMTAEQIALIDVNSVNVFVKDEAGVSYFWKNGDTGVTVSKPTSTTLRVTLDSAIFGVITKLWRFFVAEKVGYVGELSPDETEFNLFGHNSDGDLVFYKDKRFKFRTSISTGQLNSGQAEDFEVSLPFSMDTSRSFSFAATAYSGNNTTDPSLINAYAAFATQNSIRVGGRNVTSFNQSVGTQITLIIEGYLL